MVLDIFYTGEHTTIYKGRNRIGIQKGMAVYLCKERIEFRPINSKGFSNAARLEIPLKYLPELIQALQYMASQDGDKS